jgi:hypothetical protein
MVIGALATAAILFVTIIYYSRPRSKFITAEPREHEKEIIKSHKILTLVRETADQD